MRPSRVEENVVYPHEVPRTDGPLQPERPRISVGEALRRRWPIVAAVVTLFVAAAVALGLGRDPTYTAQSRLAVGRLDISAPGAVSGFALATQALSTQYSRVITARPIVDRVGREVGMPPLEVARSLSATPIEDSPVFKVEAKATSERKATAIASSASSALVSYTTKLNRSNPDSPRLFRRFRRASLTLRRRKAEEGRLRRAAARNPTSENREALARAESRSDGAQLKFVTVRNAYQFSQQNQSATSLVQVLTRPAKASSDRWQVLQLYLFIGVAAGLALGLALALAATQREARLALTGGPAAR